jgi:protein SCO1/2
VTRQLVLALLLAGTVQAAELKGGVFDPPRMAPDFTLRGSDGHELRLSRFRGKVVALGFGYTSCPDVCPTTLAELAQVRKSLGAAARDFQVIYITVDPERDTPQQMRRYLGAFDPTFVGGTGTPAELEKVRADYGIQVTQELHHSSYVYLVDREGKLRALKPFGTPVPDVVDDIKVLLK